MWLPLICRATPRAFTLIETLVVCTLIVVLMALLAPALGAAKTSARTTVCAAHLKSLGLANICYAAYNSDHMVPYYTDQVAPATVGRLWWFGFELNGPNSGQTDRPLDKSLSPLGPFTANFANLLQCPDFPYSGNYFEKFNQHAASYGYNWHLDNWPTFNYQQSLLPTKCLQDYVDRQAQVFAFADGIHFDFSPSSFNEAHYLNFNATPATQPDGYAHFRHRKKAQYVLLDGHVETQGPSFPAFTTINDAVATNLASPQGNKTIYGY